MEEIKSSAVHEFAKTVGHADRKKHGSVWNVKKCRKCGVLKMTNQKFQTVYMFPQDRKLMPTPPECEDKREKTIEQIKEQVESEHTPHE